MADSRRSCPDCQGEFDSVDRRQFLKTAGVAAAAAGATIAWPQWVGAEESKAATKPETLVRSLYDSFNEEQRKQLCFDWNHTDKRGLLRTHVNNNWQITEPVINTDFFTKDQQHMVRKIFEGIYQPEWVKRIDKQLEDDAGGFGNHQSIAMFGTPGSGKFEFVMTGRHMTVRCDGDSTDHFAFGGPIFYGHAADGFNEKPGHPGNVFWPQALAANKVYEMLDEKQQKAALVSKLPNEAAVQFQGADGKFPGIPVTELASDQKDELTKVLHKLIEPYRQSDRDEALACLKAQGGLDKCSLAFYSDGDIGGDKVWDCWRVEGPAFVWYFRGTPHVHVWASIADSPAVKVNTPAQLEYPA